MTGPLGVNFENGISSGIGSHSIRGIGPADVVGKGFKIDWDTDFGFVGLVDKGRDRKDMVFANEQTCDNFVFMSQGMEIMALKPASKTLEIDGNKVWHAGNDGSGSGLDADKLDGYHAGEFVKKSGDTATGPIYFQGGLSAEAQSKDNITTRTPSGFWQTNSATTGEGWPQTTNTWYHLLSSTHSNTGNYYAMQFAGNFFNSNDIYYRSTNGSGTTPWNKMWHSGNDGSGSGLDADLLDGKHWSDIKSYIDANAGSIVAQSLGTNGYVKFNTGLMIQWGTGSVYGSNRPQTKNFPFPFPNAAFVIRVGTDGSGWSATVQGNVINRLQYSVAYWNHGASSISYSFIAIGY